MNQYTFTLQNDRVAGDKPVRITVPARNLEDAVHKIVEAEGCPENAITSIKIKTVTPKSR